MPLFTTTQQKYEPATLAHLERRIRLAKATYNRKYVLQARLG